MKQFFSLEVLFISATLFFVYSDNFTTDAVNNKATLSNTTEENALIFIDYTKNRIANNTDQTIQLKDIKLVNDSELPIINSRFSFSLQSGHNKKITPATDIIKGSDKVIAIKFHWNGGSTDIKSTTPKAGVELAGVESDEAYAKG